MMLTIDVWLMLNCFLFKKFYLHYALCHFIPSCYIALSYLFTKVYIANKFLMSLFKPPPPLKNPAYATDQNTNLYYEITLFLQEPVNFEFGLAALNFFADFQSHLVLVCSKILRVLISILGAMLV